MTNKLTEQAFFEQCDTEHQAFFGDLIARWRAVGGEVAMQKISAALKTGPITLCLLYPSYRKKGGALRFNLPSLEKARGETWMENLAAEVRGISELETCGGIKELVVRRPALTSLETHENLKQVVLRRV